MDASPHLPFLQRPEQDPRGMQKALDMQPHKARGCDPSRFRLWRFRYQGEPPDGALDVVKIQIASFVPFLAMKGIALEDRRKTKDAYILLLNYI